MIQTVTSLGTQALSNALSTSAEITFTKCAVGSGVFDPDTQDPRDMTALISQEGIVSVSNVRKEDDGVAVYADFNNTIIPGGTEIREMGIFAKLNNGVEFLFSYAYSDTPEIIPSTEDETYEWRFISHILMTSGEQALVVSYAAITPASIGAAEAEHTHAVSDLVSGVLDVERGGTGQTTAAGERNRLGLGNTTDELAVANGGTGRTETSKGAMYAIADDGALLMDTLPIEVGGTGKTSLDETRAYLGSVPMATSSTAATTAAKEAVLADFALYAGARVPVLFTNGNTLEGTLSLNINSTGAKNIYVGGATTSASNPATWSSGAICEFIYDGTYWHYLGSNIDGYEDANAGQAVTDLASDISELRDSVSSYGVVYQTTNIGDITLNSQGYYTIPAAQRPSGTVVLASIAGWSTMYPIGAINITSDGIYVMGAANTNITNLRISHLIRP